jgi:CubicO group peptidase (beta-lactamase class C family)
MIFCRTAVALFCAVGFLAAQTNLDDVAERTLKVFHVPGLAIGIIEDGHVLVSKGFGVRRIGESAPVTDRTLFQIASNSKAFTSAALAILVDEKKISWDERVIDVLPAFQMSDPYVSREMRIRDLLCHRSGLALGAGDLMLFPDATLSMSQFMEHLRYVPLAASFRSRYAYDNVLYAVAGQVIEKAGGMPWSSFIQRRIFDRLGMAGSRAQASEIRPDDDFASAHAMNNDKLEVTPPANLGPAAPAGAINSSVGDLLKWVNVQLKQGEYTGGRLFSAKQSEEMWTPQIFIPPPEKFPAELMSLKPNFQAYGLGWVVYDYRGQRIVYHTGGLAGMVTRITLVPAKKLGIVVLTNQEEGGAFQAITQTILDHYLGAPPEDWVSAFSAVTRRHDAEASDAVAKATAGRNAQSKPSLALEKYAGRYRDVWYGDIVITRKGDGLSMQFTHSPKLSGRLEHFQYDTFIARWKDRSMNADAYVTFALNPDGSIRDAKMAAVSPATDFSFDFHDLDLKPVASESPAY